MSNYVLKPDHFRSYELILHGDEHLKTDKPFDKRIAFISYDNSIEVSIFIYLILHHPYFLGNTIKASNIRYHNRLAYLFDFISTNHLSPPFSRDELERYHELRNELYHEGGGHIIDSDMNGIRAAADWIFRNLLNLKMQISMETLGILQSGVSSVQASVNVKPNVPLLLGQIVFKNERVIIPINIQTYAHDVTLIGISSDPLHAFNIADESGNQVFDEHIEKNSFKMIFITGDFQKNTDVEFTFILADKENNYFFENKISVKIEETA